MNEPMQHLERLISRYADLETCRDSITRTFELVRDSFRSGGKLLICGNGGSAADAEHISGELLKGFLSKRPLSAELKASLPDPLGGILQHGLPAIPLGSFLALSTAFANDAEPKAVFAQLTLALGRPGDVLFAISTSGNARNVAWACQTASAIGMKVVGLTGMTGGQLAQLADACIRVPSDKTPDIQEFHLPVYHCFCAMLEAEFFGTEF